MKKVKYLMMYFLAGALVFSACNDDDDDDGPTTPSDSTVPTATIMEPAEGESVFIGTDMHFHGKVMDETNLKNYTIVVNSGGTDVVNMTEDVSGTEAEVHKDIATTGFTAGAGTVTLTAMDAASNASAATVVNVMFKAPDNTKPTVGTITIKYPLAGTKLETGSTPNEVEFHFTDDVELGEISIRLENGSLSPVKDVWSMTIPASENAGMTEYKKTLNVPIATLDATGPADSGKWIIKVMDAAGNVTDYEANVTIAG